MKSRASESGRLGGGRLGGGRLGGGRLSGGRFLNGIMLNGLTKCLVGKTVLLRQLRSETPDALYVSVDTLERDTSLIDLVRMFQEKYRITVSFIDEIHFLRGFEGDLKELYDF